MAQRQTTEKLARASLLLPLYLSLGPERSISRVFAVVTKTGLDISRTTIARYSKDFGWVERAREWDERREQGATEVVLEQAIVDDTVHADFWRLVREAAGTSLQTFLDDKDASKAVGLAEIARVGDLATRNERLISGRATERIDILSDAMRVLIEEIGPAVLVMVQTVEQALAEIPAEHAETVRVALDGARADFAAEADRIIEAQFRARGLLAEDATIPVGDGDE